MILKNSTGILSAITTMSVSCLFILEFSHLTMIEKSSLILFVRRGTEKTDMKDLTFCCSTIFVWMTNPHGLGLSGNELSIYALIYGFTQDSRWKEIKTKYIMDFCGLSRLTVVRNLSSLVKSGLIRSKTQKGKSNSCYVVNSDSIINAVESTTDYFTEKSLNFKDRFSIKGQRPLPLVDMIKSIHDDQVRKTTEIYEEQKKDSGVHCDVYMAKDGSITETRRRK